MDRLVDLIPGERRQDFVGAWFIRQLKGLRLLAALRGMGDVGRTQHLLGRQYLLGLITSAPLTKSGLSLSGLLITIQKDKSWASKELAEHCIQIILNADNDIQRNDYALNRALDADIYITWYAQTERDASDLNAEGDGDNGWTEIQPLIVTALRNYLSRPDVQFIKASDFGPVTKRDSIARPLIEILVTGVEHGKKPTEATRKALSEVFSLDNARLSALILSDLLPRWRVALSKCCNE
jgi:hypothetical protein